MSTIKDIAQKANTSPATVSRFINGGKVKKETEKHIIDAIKELDYKIPAFARSFKKEKTRTVAFIVQDLANVFWSNVTKAAQRYFNEHGYHFIVMSSNDDVECEAEICRYLIDSSVDGVLLNPMAKEAHYLDELKKHKIPFVLIDNIIPDLDADAVLVDNVNGAYEAVETLINHGHRKIGIINGPQVLLTGNERYKGYTRAFEDYGLSVEHDLVKFGDFKRDSGYHMMMELLQQENRPTAVFVSNYYMSVGAMTAIREKKVKIPEDLSYISFDDFQMSGIHHPPLASIVQPVVEIGQKAGEILLQRMNGESFDDTVTYRLKTKLEMGGSIKNVKLLKLLNQTS